MSWRDCFAAAFAALNRGEDGAREDLQRLARWASGVLDTMMPSTAPDDIQRTHRIALREVPILMAALAQSDMLQREQQVRATYASHGGGRSATTRRRNAPALKEWQKEIQPE